MKCVLTYSRSWKWACACLTDRSLENKCTPRVRIPQYYLGKLKTLKPVFCFVLFFFNRTKELNVYFRNKETRQNSISVYLRSSRWTVLGFQESTSHRSCHGHHASQLCEREQSVTVRDTKERRKKILLNVTVNIFSVGWQKTFCL